MTPPSQIAHYRITSKLGEGGMGAVYRATDTKLGRDVAIKVLPEEYAQDTDRMARFAREAQVLAGLNHPNIAAIYGLEERSLVLELVEGPDLAERIARGPIPLDEALPIARQLAEALEYAHERGIIHRDLKPANLKVTPEGKLKVLDFGLAKALASESRTAAAANPMSSPTMTMRATQAGVIMGTAGYMSPEQAKGKPVDRRADIWAFGVVVAEMLTGEMMYRGETVSETLASVIKDQPALDRLPAETPAHVRRLLRRCLEKDPQRRLQAIGEARIALDEAPEEAPPPAVVAPQRAWIPWAVAGALALALLAVTIAWLRPAQADPGLGAAHFLIPLPPGTAFPTAGNNATQWVPSPDGRNVAMVLADLADGTGGSSLWVRPIGSTFAYRLERTEEAHFPFWSPDGQSIGFFAGNKLKRTTVSGGSVRTICEFQLVSSAPSSGDGAAWRQDGLIVFSSGSGPLLRVPAMGGTPVAATALEKGETAHVWPQFLPDGRHILYLTRGERAEGISRAVWVQELGTAKRVRAMQNITRAVWSPPGYLLFVSEGTLFAQRMNPSTFQVEGEPAVVVQDVLANSGNGRSGFAVSQNGVLVYRPGNGSSVRQLTWRDRGGKILGQLGKPGDFSEPALSPDDKSVALLVGQARATDLWVMDVATAAQTRMTSDGASRRGGRPAWSPDGTRVAVTKLFGGMQEIAVASGKATEITKALCFGGQWSPDSRTMFCITPEPSTLATVLEGGKLQKMADAPLRPYSMELSPDGKYLAYQSPDAGVFDIHVAAFPSFASKRKLASAGTAPVWAKGGREVLYRSSQDRMLTSVEIRAGATLEVGAPKPLFPFGSGNRGNGFDVTADGERILTLEPVQNQEPPRQEIMLVLNWMAELKQQ